MRFEDETIGSHSGQTDRVMKAYDDSGEYLGHLDYVVYNGEPSVSYIEVVEKHKRKGVGTALLKNLQKAYPDTEIDLGYSSEDGSMLVSSLKKRFIENPRYDEVRNELIELQGRAEMLTSQIESWRELNAEDREDQREEILRKGDELNELNDRIYDLENELRDLRPGKSLIEGRVLGYNAFTKTL